MWNASGNGHVRIFDTAHRGITVRHKIKDFDLIDWGRGDGAGDGEDDFHGSSFPFDHYNGHGRSMGSGYASGSSSGDGEEEKDGHGDGDQFGDGDDDETGDG